MSSFKDTTYVLLGMKIAPKKSSLDAKIKVWASLSGLHLAAEARQKQALGHWDDWGLINHSEKNGILLLRKKTKRRADFELL